MVEKPNGCDWKDTVIYELGCHGGPHRRRVDERRGWVDHVDGPREAGFLDGLYVPEDLANFLGLVVPDEKDGVHTLGQGCLVEC